MTAIDTIKELYALNSDLLQSAAQAADFTNDYTLLCSVARWAAKICGEKEDAVLSEAKTFMTYEKLSVLRDVLETELKPWKFEGHIFASEEQRDEWLKNRVMITVHRAAASPRLTWGVLPFWWTAAVNFRAVKAQLKMRTS